MKNVKQINKRVKKSFKKSFNKGFTLIEIIIALMVIGALAGISLRFFAGIIDMIQRQDTKHTIEKLEDSFKNMFNVSSAVISRTDPARSFVFRIISTSNTDPIYQTIKASAYYNADTMMVGPDTAKKCLTNGGFNNLANLSAIKDNTTAGYWSSGGLATGLTTGTVNTLTYDGWNRPFCVMVSKVISEPSGDARINYRSVVVMSSGADGIFDSGHSFNTETGVLTEAPNTDDVIKKISGKEAALAKLDEVKTKLDKAISIYENYFRTRFLSNPQRDAFKNYFAYSESTDPTIKNQWDTSVGAVIPVSSELVGNRNDLVKLTQEDKVTKKPVYQLMGLSKDDVVTGPSDNDVMYYDNSSDLVRNPFNSNANMRTPPYTASFYVCPEPIEICDSDNTKFIQKTLVGSF